MEKNEGKEIGKGLEKGEGRYFTHIYQCKYKYLSCKYKYQQELSSS